MDWLSHWFHVAGIKHKGGFRGRPDTCKGLFGRECQRLRMTPRAGESEKAFQERCDRLLNALIPDLVIDLFGTELKDPTRRLQELLDGRQHLIDIKTVVYGEGYRRGEASTAAHVDFCDWDPDWALSGVRVWHLNMRRMNSLLLGMNIAIASARITAIIAAPC